MFHKRFIANLQQTLFNVIAELYDILFVAG